MTGSARLCFVFVQKERRKYPASLFRLLEVAARFEEWAPHVVIVDNDREGMWEHSVAERLTHLGGDNTDWEFSAFDRGVDWARRNLGSPEVFALVTDACLAYGDEYLEHLRPPVAEVALRGPACVGWIDSFGETCSILGHQYDAWLRTSFLIIPDEVLRSLQPLAEALPVEEIFGPGPEQPFSPNGPVSANLQRLITGWLTRNTEPASDREEGWHSGFVLDTETFSFFRAKARSILREHLLSARVRSLGVSAYDLRVVESLRSAPEVEAQDWAWRDGVMRIRRAQADPVAGRSSEVLLAADLRTEGGRKAAILLAREVLPLLRQRVSRASLSLVGPTDGSYLEVSGRSNVLVADVSEPLDAWIQGAAVLVAGPVGDAVSARAERLAADLGVPIVRGVATASPSSATGLAERLSAYLGTAAEG
jgi:hypothetical protein